jgi:hypothetical protein
VALKLLSIAGTHPMFVFSSFALEAPPPGKKQQQQRRRGGKTEVHLVKHHCGSRFNRSNERHKALAANLKQFELACSDAAEAQRVLLEHDGDHSSSLDADELRVMLGEFGIHLVSVCCMRCLLHALFAACVVCCRRCVKIIALYGCVIVCDRVCCLLLIYVCVRA